MAVAVGNVASGSSMSPEQLSSVQSSSEQDGPPNKRLRRVACSCPNCRDGEGRYENRRKEEPRMLRGTNICECIHTKAVFVETLFCTGAAVQASSSSICISADFHVEHFQIPVNPSLLQNSLLFRILR